MATSSEVMFKLDFLELSEGKSPEEYLLVCCDIFCNFAMILGVSIVPLILQVRCEEPSALCKLTISNTLRNALSWDLLFFQTTKYVENLVHYVNRNKADFNNNLLIYVMDVIFYAKYDKGR